MPVVFRSANWDTPWWVRPNSGAGRFNAPGSEPTQYLSTHPLTIYAERLRSLGPDVVADADTLTWRCWAMRIDIDDLTVVDFDNCADFGIDPDSLVGDDWRPCQAMADRLRTRGHAGLVVPSAALPGTHNVVLFGARAISPYLFEPVDPRVDVPTAHSAENSVPPPEVIPLVRWEGDPHAELEAWRSGEQFVFIDPQPSPG